MTFPRWLVMLVLVAITLSILSVVLMLFLRPVGPNSEPVLSVTTTNRTESPPAAPSPLFTEDELRLAQSMKSNPVQKVLSGNGRSVGYTQELARGEAIVGHAFRFNRVSHGAVFLFTGPGTFEYSISSGLWYKHTNTTASLNEALLQGQIDIMVNKYHVPLESLKIHRLVGPPPAEP